jgi:hypothetical protein
MHRIPGLANLVLVVAIGRFAGLIEAMTFRVKQPSMIAAAQPFRFHAAIFQ